MANHADESCAHRKADEVIAKLKAMRLAKAAELIERAIDEIVADADARRVYLGEGFSL